MKPKMKVIEKISLAIFANVILILSVIMMLIVFGWIGQGAIEGFFKFVLLTPVRSNITLGVCIILILLALKCIFFDSSAREEKMNSEGIVLANDNGKLLVSKDTIENLATSVVKGFEGAESTTTRIVIDKENNVKMDVILFVHPDAIIKDLSNNLQTKIKETIKASLDLEISEVNIKIRNITPKKQVVEE